MKEDQTPVGAQSTHSRQWIHHLASQVPESNPGDRRQEPHSEAAETGAYTSMPKSWHRCRNPECLHLKPPPMTLLNFWENDPERRLEILASWLRMRREEVVVEKIPRAEGLISRTLSVTFHRQRIDEQERHTGVTGIGHADAGGFDRGACESWTVPSSFRLVAALKAPTISQWPSLRQNYLFHSSG